MDSDQILRFTKMLIKYVPDITAVAIQIWHTIFFTSHFIQILKVLVQNFKMDQLQLLKLDIAPLKYAQIGPHTDPLNHLETV